MIRPRPQEVPPKHDGQSPIPAPTFTLSSLVEDATRIISSNDNIPADVDVLLLLERCYEYSNYLMFGQLEVPEAEGATEKDNDTDMARLLDLDETGRRAFSVAVPKIKLDKTPLSREKAAHTISRLTYDLLCAATVYITPPMLEFYVRIHCLLGSPEYLPKIFYLYANKPVPTPKTSPVVYTSPWPNSPKNAIPQALADAALEAAIVRKDLNLALAIVETTVALPAFRRNRFIRKASLPLLGAASLPLALNSIANYIASEVQVAWDPGMSKFITLAACSAYFTTLGIVGFVALTTYNDHHQRVSWQPGFPMRDRWLKEEERLYYDRIALAWGFRDKARWGEEQGEEWDALKEYLGVRGMDLDRTNLLEGME